MRKPLTNRKTELLLRWRTLWFFMAVGVLLLVGAATFDQNTTEKVKGVLAGINAGGFEEFDSNLAFQHAPIHFQDTDDSEPSSDFLTRWDYDGDLSPNNNWENVPTADFKAVAYYSVVETATHWFVVYAFYHPRDWLDSPGSSEHENDLEGFLSIVHKNGTPYGSLQAIITVFHNEFPSYTRNSVEIASDESTLASGIKIFEDVVRENRVKLDGELVFSDVNGIRRIKTTQEPQGHGIKAWPSGNFSGDLPCEEEDGVIYYPSLSQAGIPDGGCDHHVFYKLEPLWPLWEVQLEEVGKIRNVFSTFAAWGVLQGNLNGGCGGGAFNFQLCSRNSANTPWRWDASHDNESYGGEMALDPAKMAAHYFDGFENFDQLYTRNRYLQDLDELGYSNSHLPRGFDSDFDLDSSIGRVRGLSIAVPILHSSKSTLDPPF